MRTTSSNGNGRILQAIIVSAIILIGIAIFISRSNGATASAADAINTRSQSARAAQMNADALAQE